MSTEPSVEVPASVLYFQAQPMQPPDELLAALGELLAASGDDEVRREWCRQVGWRWALRVAAVFADADNLPRLGMDLNRYWAEARWGWVQIDEGESGLDILHAAAPLARAFGVESLAWSTGLLEGFYECVFKQLGADEAMQVRTSEALRDGFEIQMKLGH